MTNDSLYIKEMVQNTSKLQNDIKYYKLINIRNKIIRILIKSGLALDTILPFLCSLTICYQDTSTKPFKLDNIKTYASIQTIDMNKIHLEKESYKTNYYKNSVEYTTGFIKNNDMYERTVTTYELSKDDINNIDEFNNMTYEDLNEQLQIKEVKIIRKKELSQNDYLYLVDTVIVTKSGIDESKYKITKQNIVDESMDIILYLFFSGSLTFGLYTAKEILFSEKLKKKLKQKEKQYQNLSKKELEEMKQILLLNKNNLQLFEQTQNQEKFQLRKKNK